MIAARFHEHGDPDVLSIESVPMQQLSDDKILIEMKAAGMNHLDLWIRKGIPGIQLPMIPGSDGAGVVLDVGKNISSFQKGDKIMIQPLLFCGKCHDCKEGHENHCNSFGILGETQNGTCATHIIVSENNLIKMPTHLSFEEAAGFSLVAQTSYEMLVNRAHIKEGETVLIWGASSGVGSIGIQIAKALGCMVIAISSSKEKCRKVQSLRADEIINHNSENVYDKVMDITEQKGVDVVFEHVGQATWNTSMKVLKKGGRIVTCGATTGPKASINLTHIFYKQLSILGSTMGSFQSMKEATALLNSQKIKPIIDSVFSLNDIQKAHSYLESGNQFGKVIIKIPSEL